MELKFDPGFQVIGEYFESNWLSISSQIDSQYRVKLTPNIESNWLSISSQLDSKYILQLLGIPGRIIFPPVTQLFRSKWLHFFSQWRILSITDIVRPMYKFENNIERYHLSTWSSCWAALNIRNFITISQYECDVWVKSIHIAIKFSVKWMHAHLFFHLSKNKSKCLFFSELSDASSYI